MCAVLSCYICGNLLCGNKKITHPPWPVVWVSWRNSLYLIKEVEFNCLLRAWERSHRELETSSREPPSPWFYLCRCPLFNPNYSSIRCHNWYTLCFPKFAWSWLLTSQKELLDSLRNTETKLDSEICSAYLLRACHNGCVCHSVVKNVNNMLSRDTYRW